VINIGTKKGPGSDSGALRVWIWPPSLIQVVPYSVMDVQDPSDEC